MSEPAIQKALEFENYFTEYAVKPLALAMGI